jgi:hypothetical protein
MRPLTNALELHIPAPILQVQRLLLTEHAQLAKCHAHAGLQPAADGLMVSRHDWFGKVVDQDDSAK